MKAQLKGGPFDGDKGTMHDVGATYPDRLWAYMCPNCKDVHWTIEGRDGRQIGGEVYDLTDDTNAAGARIYIYRDVAGEIDGLLADIFEPVAA